MRFDISDLRLFVAVCGAGSITGGAARVALALASASQRLRAMEAALGHPLLLRGRDGVRPTTAGLALLGHATGILDGWEGMRRDLGLATRGSAGRVRLIANTAAQAVLVPDRLPGFLATHPDVAIDLAEASSERVLAAVADGSADLGIALAGGLPDPGLDLWPLRADPLALVVPRHHPLARRRRVRLSEAAGTPFLGLPADSPLQRFIERHAGADGLRLVIRARPADIDSLCRMLAEGPWPAVLPAAAVRHRRGLAAPLLADAWADRRLMLVRARNRPVRPCVVLLADHLLAAGGGRTPSITTP